MHVTPESTETATTGPAPVVVVSRACVTFDGECVVDEVTLSIEPGEFVAVLGENGAGKTTLMRAILGLVPLSHGAVRLHGVPVDDYREWSRIGYVPQRLLSAGAVPMSVHEVVASARWGPRSRWRLRGKHDQQAERDALETVGLWDRRDDRLDTLSGGQQRRVLIARALATGADTFVLDEPTAGIDAESQARLAGTLAELRDAGRTVILVTHELGPLADLATRAVVLGRGTHGSVRYDGPPRREDLAHHHAWHHSEELGPPGAEPRLLEG
ncbi:MAG: metal ABC transporter ATP-binding protein [Candidatus Nanopelagicales bacterium]